MRGFRRFSGVVALVGLLTALGAGCSNDEEGRGDAPVGERHESPRQVWVAPDLFPNITAWCIGQNGAYVTTREAAPVIIPDDPNCAEGGVLADR